MLNKARNEDNSVEGSTGGNVNNLYSLVDYL